MGKFTDGIHAYRVKVEALAEDRLRKVIFELGRKVIERTPVGVYPHRVGGRARGNWQPNIGPEPIGADGTGDALGAVAGILPSVKVGNTVWLSNNLPYIPVLEYGLYPNPPKGGAGKTIGGYSTQAPAGIVRIAALEFDDIVENAKRASSAGD